MMHQACLLLGSNIEPEQNLPIAVRLLQERLSILRVSSVWESASADCCYPDYLNLAMLVSTSLNAEQLKTQVLRPLEAQMGRVRTEDKNASRTIDFDIITYDDDILDPSLWQHVHLAKPVSEILPELRSQSGETLSEAAKRLAQNTPIQRRMDISFPLSSSNVKSG